MKKGKFEKVLDRLITAGGLLVLGLVLAAGVTACCKRVAPASFENAVEFKYGPVPPAEQEPNEQTPRPRDPEVVHFAFNSAKVEQSEKQKLQALGVSGTSKEIIIYGHTDDRGSTDYNMCLGFRRAAAVWEVLRQEAPGAQFVVNSFGESEPLCRAQEEECWARNRRVEIEIK